MIYPIWRLSEYTPDNLGVAFTDDGLLLGRTPLIERRDGRFVVREPSEIARLIKYSFPNGVAVDRLMPGLARVASALNANDQALARIAAVHLKIPDIPSAAKRNAMIAEDALIKYERDEGGVTGNNWNPALHPRTGTPPNPGWFAPVDGGSPSHGESRQRLAENVDLSYRTDAAQTSGEPVKPAPSNPMDEPATFADRFGAGQQAGDSKFWSTVWPAIKSWLEEPVPEYDLESGEVVGERPRWHAIAPYLGISAATAAIFRHRGIRTDDRSVVGSWRRRVGKNRTATYRVVPSAQGPTAQNDDVRRLRTRRNRKISTRTLSQSRVCFARGTGPARS
jgi:hypothetical protein